MNEVADAKPLGATLRIGDKYPTLHPYADLLSRGQYVSDSHHVTSEGVLFE